MYNLAPLGDNANLVSISGALDDASLITQLESLGVECHLFREAGAQTAQATIITDPNGQQLTAWYPGPEPSAQAWSELLVNCLDENIDCFIQAPLRGDLMQIGVSAAQALSIPVIWCPGQFADQLSADEIGKTLEKTQLLVGNSHEISYLRRFSNLRGTPVVETQGPAPVKFVIQEKIYEVPVPEVEEIDPTGCGDAFLAGVAHFLTNKGLANNSVDWRAPNPNLLESAVEFGIKLAHLCIQELGCQSHDVSNLN